MSDGTYRALLIDVLSEGTPYADRVRVVDVGKGEYREVADLLRCDLIDHTGIRLADGVYVDAYVDDEGLLRDDPVVSAWNFERGPRAQFLAGSILIVGQVDEEGYETSLTDEQIEAVRAQIIESPLPSWNGEPLPLLVLEVF